MSTEFSVAAIVSGRNVEDVVAQSAGALIADGVPVYFLDQQSEDRTVAEIESLGDRVIGLESIAEAGASQPAGATAGNRVLERAAELAGRIEADWFVLAGADEFLESPWSGEALRDGIRRVDALGYNAIAVHPFHFVPTSGDADGTGDIRRRLQHYDPDWVFDHGHVRCWKKTRQPVSWQPAGCRSVQFAGRRIFPFHFLLRRYPIRAAALEPQARPNGSVAPSESPQRHARWRVTDDGLGAGVRYVRDPQGLARFDPEEARLQVLMAHREFERLERVASVNQDEAERLLVEAEALRAGLAEREAVVSRMMASRSWKLTAPLRAADRLLRGREQGSG